MALKSVSALCKWHTFVHLLMVSLVAMSVSFACERCLAFGASGGSAPVHHPESHCGKSDTPACDCHAFEPASVDGGNMLVAATQTDRGQLQPAVIPVPTPRPDAPLPGAIRADGRADVPRLSPIRSFCIQLE
jgi:hypothetical protein